MRMRLRDLPDLDATYPEPHDAARFGWSHDIRVRMTIALGAQVLGAPHEVRSIGDLSTGNGAIPVALALELGCAAPPILGDYAPGYPITGRLEDTLADLPRVDLYVCSETLEHLEHPEFVLHSLRGRCDWLLFSTPVHRADEPADSNGEHVWQWDRAGVLELLAGAGFEAIADLTLEPHDGPYRYLIGVAG